MLGNPLTSLDDVGIGDIMCFLCCFSLELTKDSNILVPLSVLAAFNELENECLFSLLCPENAFFSCVTILGLVIFGVFDFLANFIYYY